MVRDAAAERGKTSSRRRLWLGVEMVMVFGLLPLSLWFVRGTVSRWILPVLLAAGGFCFVWLWRDPSFDRRRLWGTRQHLRGLGSSLVAGVLPAVIVLAVLTWQLRPDLFLAFPREEPRLWLLVMLLYPLLSVYPQEVVFRTFFFHRYAPLFRSETPLVVASATSFARAHVFFANWVAPVLTLAGGLLFANSYARTRSTLRCSIDHSLWGDVLFTVGLGWYFYGGSVRAALASGG